MQNRYVGDVGDFGKLGMLRCLEKAGLSIGINWYLVEDENHNNDGKHIGYLSDEKYHGCDDDLLTLLNRIIEKRSRMVLSLERANPLKKGKYFHEILHKPNCQGLNRIEWHQDALLSMRNCELVFLDPDNGLIPKSVRHVSAKSIKYVFPEEIVDYYNAGHSVVFYSHRTRECLEMYLARFSKLFGMKEFERAIIKGVSFRRGTVRDYFFIIHSDHVSKIEDGLSLIFNGKWCKHFSNIDMPNKL